jgi:hypothetical protein
MVQVVTCSTQALWNKNMAVGRVNSVLLFAKSRPGYQNGMDSGQSNR